MERKHRKQMSHSEINFAESLVHRTNGWNFAVDHAMERMEEKNISKQDLLDTLKLGEVIEVNDRGRIVLRLRIKLRPDMKRGTCVVVSIRDKVLVTAWFNSERDHHATLDLEQYRWNVNAVEYLTSLLGEAQ